MMSRHTVTHQTIASRTAFDSLVVDSIDESDDEEVQAASSTESTSHAETKLSKSAIKKAQKLARTERKQREKALAKALRAQAASTTEAVSASAVHISKANDAPFTETADSSSPPSSAPPANQISASNESRTESNGSTKPALNGQETKATTTHHAPPHFQPPSTYPSVGASSKEPAHSKQELPLHQAPQDVERMKKRQSFITRTLWTFIMIGGFVALLLMGHAYMVLLVMLCQTLVYREVTALFSLKAAKPTSGEPEPSHGKDPWSKTLNWYFFAVTNYFLYGESIIYYFKHVVFADAQLLPFATNHRMISFILYTLGFMGFVMSLKKGYLKQQFGLFCWVHMSLLLIVVSSHFIVNNILEGLIWLWVPCSLVICNDSFAYIWGITLGRTPLIKLSPKKTVEGFIGAFWSTMIFGLIWGTLSMRFPYMICPVHDLGVSAWSTIQCKPNPVFMWKEWRIWAPVAKVLSALFGHAVTTIPYTNYHFHLLFLSFFASLVAPFGGFFASGFKRAFNIKDFGHSIPGHGGMTDRMDCQFLMGVFTYVYYSSLIREHRVTVGGILQTIVSGLTVEDQLRLIADLKKYLGTQGIKVP